MTTDTPSGDEYRVNLLTVVQMFADGVLPTGMRGVATSIDDYAAAVRAEAIRERDEVREALREGVGLLKDALYGGLLKPDEEMPPVGLCWVCGAGVETATDHFDGCFVPRIAAFLARFPEGDEG